MVGQKTITDVPGIPKPDTKLLAGCRESGRSQALLRNEKLASCLRSLSGAVAIGPHSPKVRGLGNPVPVWRAEGRSNRQLFLALVGFRGFPLGVVAQRQPGSVFFSPWRRDRKEIGQRAQN